MTEEIPTEFPSVEALAEFHGLDLSEDQKMLVEYFWSKMQGKEDEYVEGPGWSPGGSFRASRAALEGDETRVTPFSHHITTAASRAHRVGKQYQQELEYKLRQIKGVRIHQNILDEGAKFMEDTKKFNKVAPAPKRDTIKFNANTGGKPRVECTCGWSKSHTRLKVLATSADRHMREKGHEWAPNGWGQE